jgi:hypothetical protein
MKAKSVLVVEHDPVERHRIGSWLESDGFDVIECPGPGEPDYSCLGGRGEECPLAHAADVVVLDLRLASDEMMSGTPGWELLLYYVTNGKRVVALSGIEDSVHLRPDDDVSLVARPPHRQPLLDAVRDMATRPSLEPKRTSVR